MEEPGQGLAAPAEAATLLADWRAGGFGLYVHWPFCQAKCPYCDFNSHVWRTVDHGPWSRALAREMASARAWTGPRTLDTIFFGGGTPSLMEPGVVGHLIAEADRLWGLAPGAEITLEANPTSVEARRFRGYRAAGVNRVSLGVQALDDGDLKALGRLHTTAEALAAVDLARATFDRVSFDLIYARMGQTPDAWARELDRALGLGPDHLSLYQLTIEPGTRFFDLHARGRLHVPEDGPAAEMYALTAERTDAAGLPAYEVSNHARAGAESRHNLIYWRYGDYAGIGPGAHGRQTGADGARVAIAAERDPAAWLRRALAEGHAHESVEPVPPAEQADEMMLMGLRLSEGVSLARYARLAGRPLPEDRIAPLVASGHLVREGDRLIASAKGRIVLNAILGALLA